MDTREMNLIREIADRVASWEDERAELKLNIDAEIAAAKDKGTDAAELRRAIANRRKRNKDPDKYDRKETTRAQYELALGMPAYAGILDDQISPRTRTREAFDAGRDAALHGFSETNDSFPPSLV